MPTTSPQETSSPGSGYSRAETPHDGQSKQNSDEESRPRGASVALQVGGSNDKMKKAAGASSAAELQEDQRKQRQKEELEAAMKTFHFRDLYRFASGWDMICLAIGLLMTTINGALFPCMALIFGKAISSFQPYDSSSINEAALLYAGVAVLLFITDYTSYVLFYVTAERQMKALREQGFQRMLYLDISWYDQHDALQLSSRLTGDTVKIKDGMGQKLGDSLRYFAQFVTGYVIGFVKGWDISLIMACVMPCIAISLAWLLKTLRQRTEWAQKIYAEAGAVAEETLGSMRTVISNNGELRAIERFSTRAKKAEEENVKLARITSIVIGIFFCSMWLMYAAGLWYGGSKVSHAKTDPGTVFSAFFGILLGSMAMAQISPNITAVAQAKGAAAALYQILATTSEINSVANMEAGQVPDTCSGAIEARGVHFAYPSRPDAPILVNYDVKIASGQTVAFVGASGGGKSTLISLLQRFYDPVAGQIFLDGRDITTLQVKWLRSQMGLVSQEPVLFATSIHDNIAFGLSHQMPSHLVTRDQVISAAMLANAHTFIMGLPKQYDTLVGEKGVALSGGQKQRIAIARALVREPKILVLDEATSALDAESERVVQAALNELMDKTNMTTLVIAHRLSTIRRADKIVVLSGGCVVEEGPHETLMEIPSGVYRHLYTLQENPEDDQPKETPLDEYEEDEEASNQKPVRTSSGVSLSRGSNEEPRPVTSPLAVSNVHAFSLWKVAKLCNPERKYFVVGSIAAAICGCSMPGSALLVSGLVSSMTERYAKYQQTKDHAQLDKLYHQVEIYGLFYVGGAVVLLVATAVQQYCFKFMAEKLTSRLRNMNFAALCRQPIAFFDETKNATGALAADLATNAAKVALISGDAQGRMIQALFTFVSAMVISFLLGSWLLTLVMLAVFPLLIFGQVVRVQQMKGSHGTDYLSDSGAHASQALSNIRTVISLGLEPAMIDHFRSLLKAPLAEGTREAHINGLALGFSSFIMFAVYSLVFWYGGTLVGKGSISFTQLIRTLMAIMMSAQGIGSAASWLADAGNSTIAGATIFGLTEAPVSIDSFAEDGLQLSTVAGRVEFQKVLFRYPTRPEVTVLRNYSLVIEAGQTVAFCGPSGGGKSTVIALLERFYDPARGCVMLDGHDIKTLNLRWLRSQLGLVGQEPTLFIGTIADNIAYGLNHEPSREDVMEAAKMANAHQFITQFPDGYDTQVGMKGEKLSGGQKQRIAIARAILKNPSILLLDEATSALDSESERIVQAALDKIVLLQRRTTIIIAHRLSTIRKADKICVVSGGKIAEQGTHSELLARDGGIYAKLVSKSRE